MSFNTIVIRPVLRLCWLGSAGILTITELVRAAIQKRDFDTATSIVDVAGESIEIVSLRREALQACVNFLAETMAELPLVAGSERVDQEASTDAAIGRLTARCFRLASSPARTLEAYAAFLRLGPQSSAEAAFAAVDPWKECSCDGSAGCCGVPANGVSSWLSL